MLDPVRHLVDLARFALTRSAQEERDGAALRELETVPLDLPTGLVLEWLGVAGYRLTYEGHTLLVDPYLSRAPFRSLVQRRPLLPDPASLDRFLPNPGRVVGVVAGHTHFDHAVDTPAVAGRFGCPALGSRSLVALMALHGLEQRAVEVDPYRAYELGPFAITLVPSAHSKILLGLAVPFPGELTCSSLDRLTPSAYRCGQAWGIHIAVGGTRIYHQGSADLIDDAIRHHGVDVFLAGVAGREFSRDYWGRILPKLDPRAVVACHFDDFFRPLGSPMRFAPNVNLARVREEVATVSADIVVSALPLLQPITGRPR